MQNAAGSDAVTQYESRNETYHSIVSELESLLEHIQSSMKRLEMAIAQEAVTGGQELAANVVVLDDVTPRYAKASAALNRCNAGLGAALHFLQDSTTSKYEAQEFARYCRRQFRMIAHA